MEVNKFAEIALSFPNAETQPHFEKQSFRVKKKIFATLDVNKQTVSLKLPLPEQSVFIDFDAQTFTPATGAWGKQGWTLVQLQTVREDMLLDALDLAYNLVNSKK